MGRRLFTKPESRIFKPEYLLKAQHFFEKHGGKAIILGRFMPIVRTMVPMVAGAGSMTYHKFFTYNVVGAFLWAVCVTLAGYFLGSTIPGVDKYLLPIIALILIASVAPSAIHIWKENGEQIKAAARRRLAERRTLEESEQGRDDSRCAGEHQQHHANPPELGRVDPVEQGLTDSPAKERDRQEDHRQGELPRADESGPDHQQNPDQVHGRKVERDAGPKYARLRRAVSQQQYDRRT
jgi:SNARE associated Golgi protein